MRAATYQEAVVLHSPADPRASLDVVSDVFEPTARVKRLDERTVEVLSGSRLAYRLLGVLLGSRVPVRLRFEILPSDAATRVALTMSSDAGWYLFTTAIAEQAYRRRFAEVTEQLSRRGFTTSTTST